MTSGRSVFARRPVTYQKLPYQKLPYQNKRHLRHTQVSGSCLFYDHVFFETYADISLDAGIVAIDCRLYRKKLADFQLSMHSRSVEFLPVRSENRPCVVDFVTNRMSGRVRVLFVSGCSNHPARRVIDCKPRCSGFHREHRSSVSCDRDVPHLLDSWRRSVLLFAKYISSSLNIRFVTPPADSKVD